MAPQEAYKPPPPSDQTMKAVRFHGQRDLRYEDIPVPQIRKGQVKLRPAWVGICGSGECFRTLYEAGSSRPVETCTNISVDLTCVPQHPTRLLERRFL